MASEPVLAALDVAVVDPARPVHSSALADYWKLTKPEINFLIALATTAAFRLGSPASLAHFPWALLLHTLLGTILVASGASTLNQVIERRFDAQMRRTSRRPIAACRIAPNHALVFGALLSLAGVLYLALTVRVAASLLALFTMVAYLFLYTPLKRRTPMCTFIGAIPGATPVLIGYVATAGKLDFEAWLLYAILFLWQFPHFMAIAWMYREDYARAGYQVLPTGPAKIALMGWQSALPALVLVPITFTPVILRHANPLLAVGTLALSLGYVYCAARLAIVRTNEAARRLLLVSIVYVPMIFALQVLTGV